MDSQSEEAEQAEQPQQSETNIFPELEFETNIFPELEFETNIFPQSESETNIIRDSLTFLVNQKLDLIKRIVNKTPPNDHHHLLTMSDFMLDENPNGNGNEGIVDEPAPSNPPVEPLPIPTIQIDPDYNLSGSGNQAQTSIFSPEAQANPPDIELSINPFLLAAQGHPLAPAAQTDPAALEPQTNPPGQEWQFDLFALEAQTNPPAPEVQATPPAPEPQMTSPTLEAQANPPAPLLNALHFATLLHMPIHILELIAKQPVDDPIRDPGTLYTAIEQIHEWSFRYPPISSPAQSPETQKCLEYDDQRCIVTGHEIKTSCHVIPFCRRSMVGGAGHRINSIRSVMNYLVGYSHLSRDVESQELLGILSAEVDIPKMHWNLITLSPNIATLWERGVFAFRWLYHSRIVADNWSHVGKVRITLEFVWMPFNRSRRRLDPFDLNEAQDF
ncbi:hypothetical protein FPSE_02865 [Fusarium pseudograminearum CS3096]|uniref:HNH nuclease domain-containing protein n=1 Tax=Fusarium pseudograminearum (strain CS3096) TaxID=1028729 RepID=K3W241_FUSPC|nr:hypothetical protein FPSE_02865 [Fusarium pseudograminearum CS3096]EKJ76990.1 hypothetical protein FPSE_02865 [Fusarium pseudograminearum CS3096]